ncbi:hypothetical protein [Haloferula sp.]|uniref:hypothetical protein n=1 Tax=Haloferula sp. TaxID=2497595 RepID=UPI00329ED315
MDWLVVLILALAISGYADPVPDAPLKGSAESISDETLERAKKSVIAFELPFQETKTSWYFTGVWIDGEGRAVVPLQAVAFRHAPRVFKSDGAELKFERVLAVDEGLDFAVVQLDAKPAVWLAPEVRQVKLRESLAVVWKEIDRGGQGEPDVRPCTALAFRKFLSLGPAAPPLISLGMYASGIERGAPVVSSRGGLAAVFRGEHHYQMSVPKSVIAVDSHQLLPLIEKARANPEGLAFPLEKDNPYDAGYWEYQLSPAYMKRHRTGSLVLGPGETEAEAKRELVEYLGKLLHKHPKSRLLKKVLVEKTGKPDRTVMSAALSSGGSAAVMVMTKANQDAKQRLLDAAERYGIEGPELDVQLRELERALLLFEGKDEELAKHIERDVKEWGGQLPAQLAQAHASNLMMLGKMDEARAAFESALENAPDAMIVFLPYRSFLMAQRDFDAVDEVDERIWELEDFYKPVR